MSSTALKSAGRIAIIGAGPGGLTSAMLLASKGFDVSIYEKGSVIGGRSQNLKVGHTNHDMGPTMLMMKFVLDQCFKDIGRKSEDYLKFHKLDPMYRLVYEQGKHMDCYSSDHKDKMIEELRRNFPEDTGNYEKYMEKELKRYKYTMPLLQKTYNSITDVVNMDSIKALPHLDLGRSIFGVLGDSFQNPLTKLSFSFQSKYLGMTPWECPGFFNLIPFVEHAFGVYHVEKGLTEISNQMAQIFEKELGGKIHLNTGVKQFKMEGKTIKGLVLENGEEVVADDVILNADFSYAARNLIPNAEEVLHKWKPSKLPKKNYSCSTYMLYMSMDKLYDQVKHHNIVFADDYRTNMELISQGKIPEQPSIYVRNAGVTDKTLSPEGKSGVYVLVPVPNTIKQGDEEANQFWQNEMNREEYKKIVFNLMEKKLGMDNIENHVDELKEYTPTMWRDNSVYGGAVFNLAHNIFQLLCFRPRNKFEELDNLYIAGGSTHPGSGLPTIYESGRMATHLLCNKYGVEYKRDSYEYTNDWYTVKGGLTNETV